MATEIVRVSVRNLRRVSFEMHKLAVEDLSDAAAAAKVVPATATSEENLGGGGSSSSEDPLASTTRSQRDAADHHVAAALPLLDAKISLFNYAVGENCESIVGAVGTVLILYPVYRLVEYLSDALTVDRVYSYLIIGYINVEIFCVAMFGNAALYRRMFCVWPTFLILVILVGLSPVVLSSDGEHSVAESAAIFPIAASMYALASSSKYVYSRFKGIKTSYAKTLIGCIAFTLVTTVLNLSPSFAVLIPARYLVPAHPYWYIVVTGIAFPAFTFVMRKVTLAYYLGMIRKKVERGELPVEQVLAKYATISKIVTVCLQLANIVMMYFSESKAACMLTAMLSILTEVGGRVYVVYMSRQDVKKHFVRAATKKVKDRTPIHAARNRVAAALAEPGVYRLQDAMEEMNQHTQSARLTGHVDARAEDWLKDVVLDRCNQHKIKIELLDAGEYTKEEEDKIKDGLGIIEKLSDGHDKHPDIILTKHNTGTPLQTAHMCYDKKQNITFGKVTTIVHGASALDIMAYLADYDSNVKKNYQADPNLIKSCVLEHVNNHNLMVYLHRKLPYPLRSRDLVWNFIAKRLTDDQYLFVAQPSLHKDAPITSDVVRADSTRVYRITKGEENVTKLELFVTVDMKGLMPTFVTRTVILPVSLSVGLSLYFMEIKEHTDYDEGGEDAKMLGQLFMDELRKLNGKAVDAMLQTLFSRTAALRYLRNKCPWFEAVISVIIANKLAVTDTDRSVKNEDDSGTALDPASAGKSFARYLQSNSSPEEGVEDWICSQHALVTLDEQETRLFRPFMSVIAKNLLAVESAGDTASEEKNWEFVLCMIAARWGQDIVAEKSCILVATFVMHLFQFSNTSANDLLQIMGIFYGFEVVTDILLVYVLDGYYHIPFRSLPRKKWKDVAVEMVVLTQILISVACGLNAAYIIVRGNT